jgi:hypothetical protein
MALIANAGRPDGPLLAIIEYLSQLLITDPSVLHGIGGMAVAELALDRRNVARFRHNVLTHSMASAMGGFTLNSSAQADIFQDSALRAGF